MKTTDAEDSFRRYVADRGESIDDVDADAAISLMLGWYRDARATDVVDERGDAILFQWGTYSFGGPETFRYDLTRQFITDWAVDDDAFWQLSLTLHYDVTDEAAALGDGNEWCWSPDDLAACQRTIDQAAATDYAQSHRPARVELYFGQAG